jgi:DNA-directed RNA polymerase specialized sigma24 family protein
MSRETQQMFRDRAERALELHNKGIAPAVIAERLGIPASQISTTINRARRREKAKQEQEA